jgi:hypothetical protein
VTRAAGGDPAAEKEATTLARGLAVRGGAWPARVTSAIAGKLGDGKPASVRSSYGLFLLGQLAVDRGACADVAPLVEASAGVQDAGRARHRPELLFLDAGCRLNAGRAADAAERFGALLREYPDSPRAREAAYFRFRALDVARTADASLTDAYEAALRAYLGAHARADGAAEARFCWASSTAGAATASARASTPRSAPARSRRARLGGIDAASPPWARPRRSARSFFPPCARS